MKQRAEDVTKFLSKAKGGQVGAFLFSVCVVIVPKKMYFMGRVALMRKILF